MFSISQLNPEEVANDLMSQILSAFVSNYSKIKVVVHLALIFAKNVDEIVQRILGSSSNQG